MRLLMLLALMATMIFSTMPGKASADTKGMYVTQILVKKSERKLYLMNGNRVLKSYDVDLGTVPTGTKRFQGDRKTPEGRYSITHRNPQSAYYLSLGVSYPNAQDRSYARSRGKSPGGDIFIHGRGQRAKYAGKDWTAGCIAVTDAEMAEIYRYVNPGTTIWIVP
jgi:murein L,D-transpeptidase YafK